MMFMRSVIVFIILILLIRLPLLAQERNYHVLKYKITGNDTLPFATITGAEIYAVRVFDNKRQANKNNRLIRNVKAVYPWAKLAGAKLVEYESILLNTESKKEQRKIMKQVENEIQEEYGGELRKLTISQGKILIKLIDRETGDTSYDLVQDFRGNFVAFFYQSFARIFGYNLKERYDPEGSDRNIEIIVKMIEQGMI
jgi:hypothetical protein